MASASTALRAACVSVLSEEDESVTTCLSILYLMHVHKYGNVAHILTSSNGHNGK